jgi:16S rRNA G1207 methylase RsmC
VSATPTEAQLRRLVESAHRLHRKVAAAMTYDATEPAMVRAERALAEAEAQLAEALKVVQGRS